MRERCHVHVVALVTGELWFYEPLTESLGGPGNKRAVEVPWEVIYAAVLLVRVVGCVEVIDELCGTVERGEEISFGGEGSSVRGGGKEHSRVIFASVEVGMVL